MPQLKSQNSISRTRFTSSPVAEPSTALPIATGSTITTKLLESLESLSQVMSTTAYNTISLNNYTSSSQSLVKNCSSSVKSNITIDRWLISSLKSFSSSLMPTMQPSTTELTTPLFTTFAPTTTSEIYSVFTSDESIYVVYDQIYKITESSTTFNTHFPQTTVLKEADTPLTFTIPTNTITGDAKLYQNLSGALNTQEGSNSYRKTGVIVGSTVGVVIGVVVVIFIGLIIIRNKRNMKKRSKKGFSHDIGKRVSCDEVAKGQSLSNPFLNELCYKVITNGEGLRDSFDNRRDIRRGNSSDSLFIAHPYYGTEDNETESISYLSSFNESNGSSIEETSSNASTITRPNIEQTNSFLREVI